MVYEGTVWNLKTRIRYDQDNPGLSVKSQYALCLWMLAYLFPLWVMSLLQVSICTSSPLFILHISMYSWRWRFMSDFAVANSNYRETYSIKTGLMGCYTYISMHMYSLTVHYAFSIQYKLQEKSNTITCTYKIYDLWLCEGGKSTMLHPWQDIFQKPKGLFCDNDQLTVHYLA